MSATLPDRGVALGAALRRWRVLHRVKQSHAAERLDVAQSTVSRWEAGVQRMERAEQSSVETLVSARIEAGADRVLAALVEDSPRAMHLICDHSHRLLACSRLRASEFMRSVSELRGQSLRRYATEMLVSVEARLDQHGWFDLAAPEPLLIDTGVNRSPVVPIRASTCRWTRLILSDGGAARLVETLPVSHPVNA